MSLRLPKTCPSCREGACVDCSRPLTCGCDLPHDRAVVVSGKSKKDVFAGEEWGLS